MNIQSEVERKRNQFDDNIINPITISDIVAEMENSTVGGASTARISASVNDLRFQLENAAFDEYPELGAKARQILRMVGNS